MAPIGSTSDGVTASGKKAVRLSKTANPTSKFGDLHLHPRRSHRPIIAKGPKGQRVQKEVVQDALTKAATLSQLDAQRIKRLQKLCERHENAGRHTEADAVKDQIKVIQANAIM